MLVANKNLPYLTGTIFENTKLPLNKWIACIWMATSYKRRVSSYQVARNIGVTQKTAWLMMQRILKLFEQLKVTQFDCVFTGDETIVGGKNANHHVDKKFDYKGKGYRKTKFPNKINVFGLMELGGKVMSISVPDLRMSTLQPLMVKHLNKKSTIMTDEHHGYRYICTTSLLTRNVTIMLVNTLTKTEEQPIQLKIIGATLNAR